MRKVLGVLLVLAGGVAAGVAVMVRFPWIWIEPASTGWPHDEY